MPRLYPAGGDEDEGAFVQEFPDDRFLYADGEPASIQRSRPRSDPHARARLQQTRPVSILRHGSAASSSAAVAVAAPPERSLSADSRSVDDIVHAYERGFRTSMDMMAKMAPTAASCRPIDSEDRHLGTWAASSGRGPAANSLLGTTLTWPALFGVVVAVLFGFMLGLLVNAKSRGRDIPIVVSAAAPGAAGNYSRI